MKASLCKIGEHGPKYRSCYFSRDTVEKDLKTARKPQSGKCNNRQALKQNYVTHATEVISKMRVINMATTTESSRARFYAE
jgi:hypothetical protein